MINKLVVILFAVIAAAGGTFATCNAAEFAQSNSATVRGKVADASGHAVVGAHVETVNVDTNVSYPTITNEAGIYSLPTLPPGTYRIVVEKQSFLHAQRPLVLHAGDNISVDFDLGVYGINSALRRGRKNVLAWIDPYSGAQSHGAAIIERLGYESGLWDTYIRTDSQSFNDLNDFDAIFFLGGHESNLPPQRAAELLSFVKNGKGFVAGHNAADVFRAWPEYGQMLGGRLAGHPWGFTDETFVIEDPHFPGMQQLPRIFSWYDESYEIKELSRDNVDVLMRLDASKLDMTKPHRKDGDFPQAWAKTYGKGRVYYNTLGHDVTVWDNPAVQKMYFEAIKWALGLTDAKLEPHPLVRIKGSPEPLK